MTLYYIKGILSILLCRNILFHYKNIVTYEILLCSREEKYMSEFIKDIDKDLGTIISKKMHMQPVLAEKWS